MPPNCTFEVDDAEDEWVFPQKFDYIHGRLLGFCFKDTLQVIRSAYDALDPGGWFELQDVSRITAVDNSLKGSQLLKLEHKVVQAASNLGMDFAKTSKYKGWMEEAGFVDIKTQRFAWPTNPWPKSKHLRKLGMLSGENFMHALGALCMAVLTRGGAMTKEQVEALMDEARNDLDNRDIHAYVPVIVIYGRKPV